MKSDTFWSVKLGLGMGPLVLGNSSEPLFEALREHRMDVEGLAPDRTGKVLLSEIGTQLIFSQANPQTLVRIDVSENRVRFGPIAVIGKRAHEIVGLFKVPRTETLWHSIEAEISELASNGESASHSCKLCSTDQITCIV